MAQLMKLVAIETSTTEVAGRTQKWFLSLKPAQQKAYLKEHPNSKFGKVNTRNAGKKRKIKPDTEKHEVINKKEVDSYTVKLQNKLKNLKKDLKAALKDTDGDHEDEEVMDIEDQIEDTEDDLKLLKKLAKEAGKPGNSMSTRQMKNIRSNYK